MRKEWKNQTWIIGIPLVIIALASVPVQAKVNYEIWTDTSHDVMPNFVTLGQPNAKGTTDIFNFDSFVAAGDAQEYFVVRFTGYIKIATAGQYTFYTSSDDGSMLYIGDWEGNGGSLTLVVNNDGLHGTQEASGTINLDAGLYGIMVTFFEKTGGDVLDVSYAGPGITKKIIPADVLVAPLISKIHPYNQQVNVLTDVIVRWQDPPVDQQPSGMVYNVFFGTDPNIPLMPKVVAEQKVNSYDPTLTFNTQYYWRIDIVDPNMGNPVITQGEVFTFKTAPKSPVILTQPADQIVWAGETAVYAMEVISAAGAPLTFAWFKQSDPGTILGTGESLEIPNIQLADEDNYVCRITNEFGEMVSNPAILRVKQLLGHWPFDGDYTDKVAGNNGSAVGGPLTFVPGIVPANGGPGQAVEFTGKGTQAVSIPTSMVSGTDSWTFSFWEYTNSAIAAGYMMGCGGGSGAENIYVWRREGTDWPNGNTDYYGNLNVNVAGSIGPLQDRFPRFQWHQITWTYDSASTIYTWYVDGLFRASAVVPKPWPGFDSLFFFGNRRNLQRPFTGFIDDFRVYNFTMNATEVAQFYVDVAGGYVCTSPITDDLNGDCVLNIEDLALIAANWAKCNFVPESACE